MRSVVMFLWYRGYATGTKNNERAGERGIRGMRWFGIPVGLGIACLAALQLQRTVRRERRGSVEVQGDHHTSWQVCILPQLHSHKMIYITVATQSSTSKHSHIHPECPE